MVLKLLCGETWKWYRIGCVQLDWVELFTHKVGDSEVAVAPLAGLERPGTVGGVVH